MVCSAKWGHLSVLRPLRCWRGLLGVAGTDNPLSATVRSSNEFVPADLVIQVDGGGVGVHAQFVGECPDACPVLQQGQMGLALSAVAAHQPAVRVFPAGIAFDNALTHGCTRGVAP